MEFPYKFNLKLQLVYGIVGLLTSLLVLFLILGKIEWITALFIGLTSFLVSGFYTDQLTES